jgi:hypothetical protein
VVRIGRTIAERVGERRAALLRPIDESARRVEALARLNEAAERALRDLNPLLAAEEHRLFTGFTERAEQFCRQAASTGLATLQAAWAEGRFSHASRRESLEYANQVARDLVFPWLAQAEREAEGEFQAAARRFNDLAREQLASLIASVGVSADLILPMVPATEGFRIRRQFVFTDRMGYHYPASPWPGLIDALVPARIRRRRRQRRAEAYLADLLLLNSSRVAGDLAERGRESRRSLEAEIRENLRRISAAAADALGWAREVHGRGDEEIRRERERFDSLLAEVQRLMEPAGDKAA